MNRGVPRYQDPVEARKQVIETLESKLDDSFREELVDGLYRMNFG